MGETIQRYSLDVYVACLFMPISTAMSISLLWPLTAMNVNATGYRFEAVAAAPSLSGSSFVEMT